MYNGLMVKRFGFGMLLGVATVVGLGGAVFDGVPSVNASGSGGTDSLNVTINVACTMSGSGGNTYNVAVNPSQTASDIGPTNIKTLCNDGNGYALYAIGYSGDSYTGNNTKLIGTSNNIDTGTSSSAGDNSYWAMKLSPVTGTFAPTIMNSFDSYHAVPSDFTMVAKYTAGTDVGENAEGSTAQAYYEVRASGSQVADTYTGKVKYVLVHPNDVVAPIKPLPDSACPAQSICYAPNAYGVDGSMSSLGTVTGSSTAGRQASVSTNGTAVLIAPNYSRDGYGFAGWSTDFEATSASKVYGPSETITTSTTAGSGDADVSQKGLILYPVWIASAGSIQSWSGCNDLTQAPAPSTGNRATLSSMTALTDQRDGNTYTVAKLADGNCWMTENLRLNAEDSTDASLAQGFGDDTANNRGKFIGLAESENANFAKSTNANSLYYSGTQSGTATMDIGTADNPYSRFPRYNNNNTNRELDARYSSTGGGIYYQWYSYGNYYSWPAAMASTTHLDTYSASEAANTSLCPTGWRLPTGGSKTRITADQNNEFWNLVVVNLNNNVLPANYDSSYTPYYTGSTEAGPVDRLVRAFPNNFLYSGYFSDSSAYSRSSYGLYWSSSAFGGNDAYSFDFISSRVYPGTSYNSKYNARTVRCLLDNQ